MTDLVGALEHYMSTGQTTPLGQTCEQIVAQTRGTEAGGSAADIPLLALLATACEYAGEVAKARDAAGRWVEAAPLDPYAHYKLALLEQRLQNYPAASERLRMAASLAGVDDDVLHAVRDAMGALDALQLQQVAALREVDISFRVKLTMQPEDALEERGFSLTPQGMRQLLSADDAADPIPPAYPRLLS
jgi:tetratricopeptide (TPR) repeat protein